MSFIFCVLFRRSCLSLHSFVGFMNFHRPSSLLIPKKHSVSVLVYSSTEYTCTKIIKIPDSMVDALMNRLLGRIQSRVMFTQ